MTSQAADGPETVAASRRSKITPEREQEFYDAVRRDAVPEILRAAK